MSSEEQQEYKGKNTERRGLLRSLETSGIPNNHEAKALLVVLQILNYVLQ